MLQTCLQQETAHRLEVEADKDHQIASLEAVRTCVPSTIVFLLILVFLPVIIPSLYHLRCCLHKMLTNLI